MNDLLTEEQLREKYSNYAFARDVTLQQTTLDPQQLEQQTPAAIAAAAYSSNDSLLSPGLATPLSIHLQAPLPISVQSSKLDSMLICSTCRGLGIVKVEYNFYVRDKTCDVCNGEGTVIINNETIKNEEKHGENQEEENRSGGNQNQDEEEIPNLE